MEGNNIGLLIMSIQSITGGRRASCTKMRAWYIKITPHTPKTLLWRTVKQLILPPRFLGQMVGQRWQGKHLFAVTKKKGR